MAHKSQLCLALHQQMTQQMVTMTTQGKKMKSLPSALNITQTPPPQTGLRITITPTDYTERLNTHFSREMKNATPETEGERIESACEKLISIEAPRRHSEKHHLTACQKILRRDSFSQLSPYFQSLIRQQANANSSQTHTKQQSGHHRAQSSCGSLHYQEKMPSRPRSSVSFSAGAIPQRPSASAGSKHKTFFTQQSTAPRQQPTDPKPGKCLQEKPPQTGNPPCPKALNNLSLSTPMPRSSSLPNQLNRATAQVQNQGRPRLRLSIATPGARRATAPFPHSLAGDVERLRSNSGMHSRDEIISSLSNVMGLMTPRAEDNKRSLAQRVAFGPATPMMNTLLSGTVQGQVRAIADDDLAQDLNHLLMNN